MAAGVLPIRTPGKNQPPRHTYNNDFNLSRITYAGGSVSYTYDNDGLLTGAGTFTITRNVGNGLPEAVTGGPLNLTRTFNGYGGELESQNFVVNGLSLTSWALNRDKTGRITSKTEMIEGTNSNYAYTYDSMGRLLTLTRDGTLMEEYQYDSVGRRSYEMNVQKGISGRTFTYSDEDHLITTGDVTYQYDADGFLTTKTHGSDIAHYSYSSRGELLSVSLPDGTVIEYVNDPLGRRIAKRVNGVITEKYLWQGLTRLLAVYDGTNNLIMRFEYADGRMPVAMTIGGATYYLIYNQVGSLRIVADASGNAVKRLDYDSFGNIISEPNPGFLVPFGFASGLHDRDTGLVRFGFRDYDPQVGRWTAKDPIYFAGGDTDLYGYVLSNPIGLVDPSGLDACGNFIDALIRDCVASKDIGDLGKTFLEKRATTLKDVSGFRTELVSGGQRGGVSRHIYGHAGAILRYGRYGLAVSYFQEGIDYFQRFQEDRTKEESEAEIAGDRAARDIARVLRSAKEAGACSKKEPREGLKQILCQ